MKLHSFFLACVLGFNFGLNSAQAEDMPFPFSDPMSFTFEDGMVKAIGGIEWDTSEKFRTFLASQNKQGEIWQVPILLRSPGGHIDDALKFGQLIRQYQMSTVTDNLCASACTYIFMAGVNRVAAEGTKYGVHQFYGDIVFKDPDKQVYSAKDLIEAQQRMARLQNYASDMGVDSAVVALAANTSPVPTAETPDGLLYLSREQITTYKIENVFSPYPNGQPIAELFIPNVYPPKGKTFDLESLALPVFPDEPLPSISEILAKNFVISAFNSYNNDETEVADFVQNNFALFSNYNGKIVTRNDVAKDKTKYAKKWAFRKYEIDDETLKVTCETEVAKCSVSGEVEIRLGLLPNRSNFRNRYQFNYIIISPGQSPRITLENIQALN